jgi:transmembrane sensor
MFQTYSKGVTMKNDDFYVLAAKYLSNEATLQERARLHGYLEQEKYSRLFADLSRQWEDAGLAEKEPTPDIGRGLLLLTQKLRRFDPAFRWEKEEQRTRDFGYRPFIFRIAAAFALVLVLTTGVFIVVHVMNRRDASIAWNEKKTVMGEKSIITLLDGTKITLNADSKLTYPAHLGETSREVFLEGEAYFEVALDTIKPFVVHTGNVSTRDLGTKFDISAFPDDGTIMVSLEEGKVDVSTNASGMPKGDIILSPAQQLIYDKETRTSEVVSCNMLKALGWKDNVLIFDDEPLSHVLVPLERYYGVKFEVADQVIARRLVKANFKKESLWTVTEVIQKATGLVCKTIREKDEIKKIVFYEK